MNSSEERQPPPRAFALASVTLGWNSIGVIIHTVLAATASSVALAGLGLVILIEIGASGEARQCRALRLIEIVGPGSPT